jgi:hypothetical protein
MPKSTGYISMKSWCRLTNYLLTDNNPKLNSEARMEIFYIPVTRLLPKSKVHASTKSSFFYLINTYGKSITSRQ